jgi:Fic family protein
VWTEVPINPFITEREIFEAKNLARVVEYISRKASERELDRETIVLLHKMLISNIRDDIAGRFRQLNEGGGWLAKKGSVPFLS